MLVYHPAYDSYHGITRILKLLKHLNSKDYNIDRIRIYDYYLLFINEIEDIVLPREFHKIKNIVSTNKYNKVYNPKHTFSQLENVQDIAFRATASFGFIEKYLYEKEVIKLTKVELPNNLLPELKNHEIIYLSFIQNYFEKISLRELKQRTKLMDYRYELT